VLFLDVPGRGGAWIIPVGAPEEAPDRLSRTESESTLVVSSLISEARAEDRSGL